MRPSAPHRILIPTDFSLPARQAMSVGLQLADALGAAVTLLHVWEPPALLIPDVTVAAAPELLDVFQCLAEARTSEAAREADASWRGKVERATVLGLPSTAIVATAKAGRYDLVVMGSHGRTGLRRLLVGSVAEQVLRLAPCPVLIVPHGAGQRAEQVADGPAHAA